ncbi:hypothetical protein EJ05DRAFT_432692 [Pseudovirgaria hyperparasitica]|uniref:Na+/H+ antiporter n=1 Tax=Pseudovirgaria hyperparasitica TaxID=470096 RepID=A0A6A6WKV9_9PEZI|nr:uncharacterized protein EJ05DRAFT_432692 [Pseudovirgaria hyperparasitica]KAF2762803.1 hypothetical protein EJ05DRAFT_432692 [Pseudovirgaria hyperparasitica]
MAWEHLSITRPHLVYIILGGFTSLFMLCSSVIKERLYIGEATVATLCGIIFGPHAANLINPLEWGNTDLITLEFSRIVLVVQCFAVGVELPKSYMERHWRSVVLLLVPVMTFGWLITSLFIWGLFKSHVNWLDSLCIAACVTATDPVLASSVVGKGKFAKRVPKHLRDLLSAESGCNDGMAFPFVYLAIYLIRYRPDTNAVAFHWFCYTVLYECVFGAIFGVTVGYAARRAIRYAHERDLIDRESFLVFYFVLALFCAGAGSLLGMDDLLVGFACGVGFSNDGWFTEKTEEAHVSNVIDLLINLAFFVYFGTIIPWEQFNSSIIGLSPWRLVVLGLLVLFFRRIPIMLMLKPAIPDIKTWRESLFAGHFGPIGVGGLFVAILARAELETEETTPLAQLPEEGFPHRNIIEMIWPITVFLVIVSILVHGSSIAVFTLGKHINTLTLTMSYTQAAEDGPTWMDRLPRIQSRSKSMMSRSSSFDEKAAPGSLGPVGFPGNFLRRQKEEDNPSRSNSVRPTNRRKKWDTGLGPGGPISQSAITPQRPRQEVDRQESDGITLANQDSDTTNVATGSSSRDDSLEKKKGGGDEPQEEIYREGHNDIIEDEEGNVLEIRDTRGESAEQSKRRDERDARRLMKEDDVQHGVAQTEHQHRHGDDDGDDGDDDDNQHTGWRGRLGGLRRRETHGADEGSEQTKQPPKRGAARAYQFGNTIIVEDEDGEVLKKYDIPAQKRPEQPGRQGSFVDSSKSRLANMGRYLGVPRAIDENAEAGPSSGTSSKKRTKDEEDDDHIRFRIHAGGRRMSKTEFIQQIQQLDPKSRAQVVEDSNAPEAVKREARADAREHAQRKRSVATAKSRTTEIEREHGVQVESEQDHALSRQISPGGGGDQSSVESSRPVPAYNIRADIASRADNKETAAQRRRRLAGTQGISSADMPINPVPTAPKSDVPLLTSQKSHMDEGETAAERRRREGALGMTHEDSDSDSASDDDEEDADVEEEEEDEESEARGKDVEKAVRTPGIRFADVPRTDAAVGGNGNGSSSNNSNTPAEPGSGSGGGGGGGDRRSMGSATSGAGERRSGTGSMTGTATTGRLRWGANVGARPASKGK